jgi:hypothetical protein
MSYDIKMISLFYACFLRTDALKNNTHRHPCTLTSSDTKTSVYKHCLPCSSQREAILQALWSAIKHSSPEVVVMAKPSWKSTLKKASNDFNLQKLAKLIQEQEERIQWLPVKIKTYKEIFTFFKLQSFIVGFPNTILKFKNNI